jgi:hypothetical protein
MKSDNTAIFPLSNGNKKMRIQNCGIQNNLICCIQQSFFTNKNANGLLQDYNINKRVPPCFRHLCGSSTRENMLPMTGGDCNENSFC